MISKAENAKLDETGKFLTLDGILWAVTNTYRFDDFGVTMDTLTIQNFAGEVKEIYSYDEGETFTFEVY